MTASSARQARAFAPCHVTGFFRPASTGRDPRARGSVGAGIVLAAGVTAEARWEPGGSSRTVVAASGGEPLPISGDVARRLFSRRTGRLSITLDHDLPIGQGFGTSAAGALATGLAVARLTGATRSRAVQVAHLSELFGGGGLGGVAAILGGGLEVRLRPGIPPFGRVVHAPAPGPWVVGTTGAALDSPTLLASPRARERIARAYDALEPVPSELDVAGFWERSERFSDRCGLAPRPLPILLRALRRRGFHAAQAMFGAAFLAAPRSGVIDTRTVAWLAGRTRSLAVLHSDPAGARTLPVERPPIARRASRRHRGRAQAFSRRPRLGDLP